jgi:hypothetical protein
MGIFKKMFAVVLGFMLAMTEAAAQSSDVDISLRNSQVAGVSRCYDIRLKNNKMDKIQLNVFGSFVLLDSDGAQANFDISATTQKILHFL